MKQTGVFIPAENWDANQINNWIEEFEMQGYTVLARSFGYILCK